MFMEITIEADFPSELVGATSAMDADDYDGALTALSGLISGKRKADPQFWTHAFEGMKVYLEV